MNKKIQELAEQIKRLEGELVEEIQRIRIQTYEIRDRTVHFQEEVRRKHRKQAVHVLTYIRHAEPKHILTAPVIWCCVFPALFMDLVVTLYQAICFPVYGIPKVRRADYVIVDRHYLAYLNILEKLNCFFCSYFNGVMAYVREVAGRTEQYWCPIKHAIRLKEQHSRYERFVEYGDSDAFREHGEQLRQDFRDLDQPPSGREKE